MLQVIMLFQKQDGVDVCLYCLYMQEYGDDCPTAQQEMGLPQLPGLRQVLQVLQHFSLLSNATPDYKCILSLSDVRNQGQSCSLPEVSIV